MVFVDLLQGLAALPFILAGLAGLSPPLANMRPNRAAGLPEE